MGTRLRERNQRGQDDVAGGNRKPHAQHEASQHGEEKFPLLRGKQILNDTYIYVCNNYSCQRPVKTIEEMRQLM